MKYGTRNFPEITFSRIFFMIGPSNGREPLTNTYNTTPKLCKTIKNLIIVCKNGTYVENI